MILDFLDESLQRGEAASYASICKEWYSYFEPYIFRRLTLTLKRLDEFEAMIKGHRRSFVKYIWFRFERSVKLDAARVTFRHQLDHNRFAVAMLQLFQILSEWEMSDGGQSGITLELTAFSAADPDYSMKDTVPEELKDIDLTIDSDELSAIYDKTPRRTPKFRFTDARRRRRFELWDFYTQQDCGPVSATPLPHVRLITELVVRRQMHSSFFGVYMQAILPALPKLEFLTYEPCSTVSHWRRTHANPSAFMKEIITLVPSSIRRLQVFEDDPALYDSQRALLRRHNDRVALGRLVADLTQDKEPEALAMSFIIDAEDFFSDFRTPQISRPQSKLGWLNLKSLVLTSSVIAPGFMERVTHLLLAAARAAQHMPKLEIMELYYASSNNGGIFTYIHDEQGSLMCWESTWKWEFPPDVVADWKRASAVHGAKVFDYRETRLTKDDLSWPGSIVSLLRARMTVVHPLTYGNMMNGLNFK